MSSRLPLSESEITVLKSAVLKSGEILLSYRAVHLESGGDIGVKNKSDGSVVTEADMASSRHLEAVLKENFPADGVVSEEATEYVPSKSDRYWFVDPLDGTKSFVEGKDDFSVLVGLVERGALTAGFMYFPVRKILSWSMCGKGTDIDGRSVKVSTNDQFREKGVYIRNFEPQLDPKLRSPYMDSGLAFLSIATGDLDGAILRMTSHREWDIVAPSAIITGAGGKVTDEQGRELNFAPNSGVPKYVVASNGSVHDKLLALIK